MIKGLKAVARQRAQLERDRITLSTMIDDMELSKHYLEFTNPDELKANDDDEIDRLIDQLPVPDMDQIEATDIDTIMKSEESMEIDDMLAIQDAVD